MAYSTKLSDALHLLVFIEERQGRDLSSAAIARSLATNPSSVRQMMGRLKRAGLTVGVVGHAMPRLARDPESITMLDVYRAVEGDKPLLHLDTHTNPDCGLGVNVQAAIGEMFDRVQRRSEDAMNEVSLSQIIESYRRRVPGMQEGGVLDEGPSSLPSGEMGEQWRV